MGLQYRMKRTSMSHLDRLRDTAISMLVLDIGCGKKKREAGAIGLDCQPGLAAGIRSALLWCEIRPEPLQNSVDGELGAF